MKHAKDFGLSADNITADIDAVVKRSRGVADQLNKGIAGLMKKNKIDVVMGSGKLVAPGKLSVTGEDGKEQERNDESRERHGGMKQIL